MESFQSIFLRKFVTRFANESRFTMAKNKNYFISILFICVLLCKGVATLPSVFSLDPVQLWSIGLFTESEPEQQKKGGAKSIESSPGEEFFDHIDFHSTNLTAFGLSAKNASTHNAALPSVWLDVLSPPPNDIA